ncbi:zinc finger protein ush-like [Pollicipes pollicipes]|uniref:zinc finger protein ush-like n=1 Tax=Pollicipes pollicipes TaxID=41117 RepID=UPI0018857AA7|nr:zinc finger protein ush-like [Pollicipes pollicipes]
MFVSAEIKSEPGSPRDGRSPRLASHSPSTPSPFIIMPNLQPRGMLCSCGINFSSLSTLAAHQKYYCTNRPNADDTPEPVVGGIEPVVSPGPSESSVSEANSSQAEPAAKRRLFSCPQCSFTTDKANGLNRHMRIHAPPPGAGGDKERVEERFCHNCDIQFSSMKTYHVHKQYYCQTRLGKNPAGGSGSAEPEPGVAKEEPQQRMVALPTSPVLLIPYQVLQGATLVANPCPPGAPPTACVVLPDGTVRTLSQLAQQGPLDWLAAYGKRALAAEGDSPLDLTNKRLRTAAAATSDNEEERPAPRPPAFRISIKPPNTISEADAVSSWKGPGEPASKPAARPAGELGEALGARRNEETAEVRSPDAAPARAAAGSPTPPVPALANGKPPPEVWMPPLLTPQPAGKQGVIKCSDCGVFFYKQDNYEIHKQHYCLGRESAEERLSPSGRSPTRSRPSQGDSIKAESPDPDAAAAATAAARFQFHCVACGTKFMSLGTLQAHQAFYCAQDQASRVAKTAAAAAAAVVAAAAVPEAARRAAARPHPALATGWKCPCCDVYSPTAASAQKHLETHNNVRAFKCSLCGYKGNTLRGMRTHIRVHFVDKKSPELPEENFISCIVANSDEEDAGREDRTEKCPLCAFKSGHPETMLKHFALAHPRSRSRVSTAPSMIEHRRRASGSPAGKVSEKCPFCSFYTDSPETMLSHQLFRHADRHGSPPAAEKLQRLALRGTPVFSPTAERPRGPHAAEREAILGPV